MDEREIEAARRRWHQRWLQTARLRPLMAFAGAAWQPARRPDRGSIAPIADPKQARNSDVCTFEVV